MDAEAPRQKRTGRPAWSYRGARKIAERDGAKKLRHAPPEVIEIAPAAYLNRSDKWPLLLDYGLAREQSGKKEPVR